VVSWLLQFVTKRQEGEVSSGALFAAGLIAGGSIGGLILAGLVGFEVDQKVAFGAKYWPALSNSSLFGLLVFLLLAFALFAVGRKKLE
jgi:nitric oxide reductase large subunit